MKKILLLSLLGIGFASPLFAQKPNLDYDAALAKSLNGNDNGMKKYVLVMLKTGTETSLSKLKTDSLFTGHMQNINKLAKEGKMVVAGPLGKNENNYRGIFILNTDDIEAAKQMVNQDPAVANNLLAADYIIWFGSAALQETLKIHKKIIKQSFD